MHNDFVYFKGAGINGGEGANAEETNNKKERSVLQAKLAKLAIKIGYVGKERGGFEATSFIF